MIFFSTPLPQILEPPQITFWREILHIPMQCPWYQATIPAGSFWNNMIWSWGRASKLPGNAFGISESSRSDSLFDSQGFCANESVVKNSSNVESTLKKKHCAIAFHKVHETIPSGTIILFHERSETNIADWLIKVFQEKKGGTSSGASFLSPGGNQKYWCLYWMGEYMWNTCKLHVHKYSMCVKVISWENKDGEHHLKLTQQMIACHEKKWKYWNFLKNVCREKSQ